MTRWRTAPRAYPGLPVCRSILACGRAGRLQAHRTMRRIRADDRPETTPPTLEGINPSVLKSSSYARRLRRMSRSTDSRKWNGGERPMRSWTSLALTCASLVYGAFAHADSAAGSLAEVIQWNKTLLTIVRTPGAQPATVHPTRNFAIMHAAVYDSVNAIDATHEPYLVRVEHVSRHASQAAAAAAAAHETLVTLYPTFQTTLDQQYDQSLAQIPDGVGKSTGIGVGKAVAQAILTLRSGDGSAATPIPFVFGNAPGDYQSTPPNFPKQPVFTHWSGVTPFALERAKQFRLGPPPALA